MIDLTVNIIYFMLHNMRMMTKSPFLIRRNSLSEEYQSKSQLLNNFRKFQSKSQLLNNFRKFQYPSTASPIKVRLEQKISDTDIDNNSKLFYGAIMYVMYYSHMKGIVSE